MDTRTAILKAGGCSEISKACTQRGKKVTPQAVSKWFKQNRLPWSEYEGTTEYARVIADLAVARGHKVEPEQICPGAPQYQVDQVKAA